MRLEDISIHAWIQKYGIKTEKGVPLDFYDHMFQYDVYRDFSPQQVTMKAAQIGDTTQKILKTLYLAAKNGMDIVYTLPTDTDVKVFAGGKVNRIIANNPILSEYTADKDSVEQKKVHNGMIYYRGTFAKKAATMVTADVLVHDEIDFSDQEIIGDYESRLQHSKYKWKWVFGHPSTEGVGAAKFWAMSDQKHWFIKCPHCGLEQYLGWPESFDIDKKIYVCAGLGNKNKKPCYKEITDEARRLGRWVAKIKDTKWSGYWIPLMVAPWIPAKYIIDKFNDKNNVTEEFFYNRILGLPYLGSGNKVTKDIIMRNLTSEVNDYSDRMCIGVDTGKHVHLVMGNIKGLVYYNASSDYEELEKLLNRFKNAIAVIDQGGDLIMPRQLREKYPGRIFLCSYRSDRKTMELITWGTGKEEGNVVADRDRMIQFVIDEFTQKRIPLYGNENDWYDYWLHWDKIYRTVEETALGTIKRHWNRSGADHWVHATAYWRIAMARFSETAKTFFVNDSSPINFPKGYTMNPDQTMDIKALTRK